MGRPRKEIDRKQFEDLCGLQCTKDEICSWFDVSDKTLDAWCKRTYHLSFSEVFSQKRGKGKISLRRAQFQLAQKNASMAIWLGKQYLGQKDDTGDAQSDTTGCRVLVRLTDEELRDLARQGMIDGETEVQPADTDTDSSGSEAGACPTQHG